MNQHFRSKLYKTYTFVDQYFQVIIGWVDLLNMRPRSVKFSSIKKCNWTSISSMSGKDSTNNNLDMPIKRQMLQKFYTGPKVFIFYSIWNLLLFISIQIKPSESIGVIWCIIQNRINNNLDVVIKVLVLKNINLLQHLKFISGVTIP